MKPRSRRRGTTVALMAVAILAYGAVRAAAQAPTLVKPSPMPPQITQGKVAVPATATSPGDTADAGILKGLRAIDVRSGQATIALADGSVRTVRPGDLIGEDTVRRIESGQIVLTRRARPDGGGDGFVVVTFGAGGKSRVRVYLDRPAAAPAPEVR